MLFRKSHRWKYVVSIVSMGRPMNTTADRPMCPIGTTVSWLLRTSIAPTVDPKSLEIKRYICPNR